MKKTKLLLILGCLLILSGCSKPAATATDMNDQPIAVTVRSVKIGSIANSDIFSGRTAAAAETSITAEMAGIVEKVYVSLGQRVEKGDMLLSIKAVDASKSVDQAKAALELARASYNNALGGNVTNQLNQLENAASLARLGYDEAQRNYGIYKELYDAGGIAEDQYKKVQLALNQADQQLKAAEKAYETAKNQAIPDSQALAKKQLEQAEVAYKIATSNLDKLTLKAPASGIITTINFSDNEMISQGMPAFILSDLNKLEATLQVAEMDISKFKAGDSVSVSLSDQVLPGVVKDVSQVTDARSSLYTVNIVIDNSAHNYPAGMAVDVQLTREKSENAVLIPKKAVFEEDGQQYVYLCKDNKAVKTAVTTGLSDPFTLEITQGVHEGDTVVIGGLSLIKDGDNLFPVEKED